MWLNYIAMFVCGGGALFLFAGALKDGDVKAALLGIMLSAVAGLNAYLLNMRGENDPIPNR